MSRPIKPKFNFETLNLSAPELGRFFSVDERTVRRWAADGLPKKSESPFSFSLVDAFAWWQENINKPVSDREEKARERYWDAKADREELAVKKLQETVLPVEELEQVWCKRLVEVVKGLESQESIFPALLQGKSAQQIRELVADYNYKLRQNYARTGRYTPVVDYENFRPAPVRQRPTPKAKPTATKKAAKKRK